MLAAYGYVDGLLERVIGTFRSQGFEPGQDNIPFIKGMIQGYASRSWPHRGVAHIDRSLVEGERLLALMQA